MFSFFKRYKLNHPARQHVSPFGFMTLCERVKPMPRVEFEFAEQSLEFASDWLYQQSRSQYVDCGHFVVRGRDCESFQSILKRHLALQSVPVVLTNCHESMLNALPPIMQDNDNGEVGLISIGHQFKIRQTLEPQLGSVFHFALTRYSNAHLLCLGIDDTRQADQTWEYAEDLGCNWMTAEECSFRNRNQLKAQLSHYIDYNESLVIDIDLESLVPEMGFMEHNALDNQMVLRVLRQCLMSGKVKYIQLVGAKDKLIYSKQTKEILDQLCALSVEVTHAA